MKLIYITAMLATSVCLINCKGGKEEAGKQITEKTIPSGSLPTAGDTKELDDAHKKIDRSKMRWGSEKKDDKKEKE